MFSKLRTEIASQAKAVGGERPPWQAKSVWVAPALMLLGGGLWIKAHTQTMPPSAKTPSAESQFSDSASNGTRSDEGRGLKPSAPATFRFGASYVGGFFQGWTFQRFLKVTLLLSGAAIVLIALGKKNGWLELDWVADGGPRLTPSRVAPRRGWRVQTIPHRLPALSGRSRRGCVPEVSPKIDAVDAFVRRLHQAVQT